jgi:hypothetical protein
MNDSQHLDTLRVDAIHEPILPHDELSNRWVVVFRNPPAAYCEHAERAGCADEFAHDGGGVSLGIAGDVLRKGHKVIAGPA